MTAPVIPVVERDEEQALAPQARRSSLLLLWVWLSSFVLLIAPRRVGRLWLKANWIQGLAVTLIHFLLGLVWLAVIAYSVQLWKDDLYKFVPHSIDRYEYTPKAFSDALVNLENDIKSNYAAMAIFDKIGMIAGFIGSLVACFAVPFFVLLPVAARPGANKSCVKHVVRTVLLGAGTGHAFALAIVAWLWVQILLPTHDPTLKINDLLYPMMFLLTLVALWTWYALARAVRLDYRSAADLPKPHDPWCDECGYNLIAADLSGRCPECGRPVSLSLGDDQRLPTPWERWPSPRNFGVILQQLLDIIRHLCRRFFSMPTLTGQPAAHRWLFGSLLVIGILSFPIVPAMVIVRSGEWTLDLVSGALAMGLVWAALSCMMVGIETAGIATFSRMRGHGVFLSSAAKVTCYASILLAVWVFFGGIQLIGFAAWTDEFIRASRLGMSRTQQMLLAGALAIPHMAGLLWFELTVYRGIRAIQYSNK